MVRLTLEKLKHSNLSRTRHEKFLFASGVGAHAAGLPFRKTRVSSESVVTRISFIEMGPFSPQLLPETAKGAERGGSSGW